MWRGQVCLLVGLVVLASGCSALGIRQSVSDEVARDFLRQAVGLATTGDVDQLCTLSPAEASTCPDSLDSLGELVPDDGPRILCTVPTPEDGPLRNGKVVVVEGVDASDVPYVSEFIVYDNGEQIGVLDAVYWNGLTVESYSIDTVTWRFDSTGNTCDRGSLPEQSISVEN